MLFLALRKDQDVVHKDYHEFIKLLPKHPTHQVNKVCGGVCQTEGHYKPLIETVWSPKGSLVYAILSHSQLMETSG